MKKNHRLTALDRRSCYKLLLIMKCTIALLLFATLHVSAKTFSQDRITLKLESTELRTALKQIEKKSAYRFLYNDDVVSAHRKVSVDANNTLVTEVLDGMLRETPLGYKVLQNNLVVITQKDYILQEVKVSGKVRGAGGEGIPAVTVKIKGSNVATATGADGSYSITTPDGATLVFSSVGYVSQEVAVGGRSEINVVLQIAAKDINEVVVIGYGTASKRDLTGSITKVSGKEIADKPNANPVASLQGKVAGLSIVNNAVPGEKPDIRIRGTISLGSVNPLYVVDGIFTDNIDFLNPNDIESIEILKDPSSLAIFGVKGASGVIAVSTKRAKSGQLSINFSSSFGSKTIVDKIEMASASEFKTILAREAASRLADDPNDVILTNFINDEQNKWTGNTNWVDAVTRTALFNNSNLSLSAASDKNKFSMGFGYTLDQGLVKRSQYKRYTLTFSDEYKISKLIKVGFNFIGSSEKLPYNSSALYDARKALPIIPDGTKQFKLRNPYLSAFDSATYNVYATTPVIQNTERNPLLVIENNWNKLISDRLRAVGNVFVELNFTKELSLRTTLYKDFTFGDERIYSPVYYAYNPAAADPNQQAFLYNPLSSINVKDYNQRSTQQDYILTYKKTFDGHSVTATAGNTWYKSGYNDNSSFGRSNAGDQPIPDNPRFWYASNGFAVPANPRSNQWEYATVSFLGRVLYNYQNKYYLTASYRKDYASNINDDYNKKGQNFWAVGAGWEVTRENFMDNQTVFNFLKLKGSIGVLGNFNTGSIGGYYPFYPGVNATQATFGVNTVSVFENNYLPDPNLRWETVHAKEIGVEFNMLGNKLHGEINYYNKRTKDLLAFLKQGGVLGRLTNSGEISNSGFELSASWNQKINKDFSITVSGNLTTYKNKVISLTQIIPADPQYPNQTQAGQPIGYFYGYIVEGLYQSYADILKSPVVKVSGGPVRPGDFKYKDVDNDGDVDDNDRTTIGNPTPDFTYGAGVTLNYKGFDLTVDMAGVYGNEIYRYWATSEQKNSLHNYPKYFIEGWNGAGTSNWVPIVNAKHLTNRVPSSFGIEDGSYIRIRNFGVGYNFNVAKAKIKAARVFVNIQNLKTWKRNLGYSPEYGGNATSFGIDAGGAEGALPRIITGGFSVTF